jgi:release factor glutamine methyltransferase
MPKTIAETILAGAHQLRLAGVPEARREVASLLAYVLGKDRSFILTHADDVIEGDQSEIFQKLLTRRASGEPLQYITGHQEFFGLDFEVTPGVLIPRPETELLVETALNLFDAGDAPLICDVGAGSGCITIALLNKLRQARGVLLDISAAALTVALRNASYHAVADRAEFFISDCFEAVRDTHKFAFDLIVSNPPYVETGDRDSLQREVRDFEPPAALFAGADGLSVIRRLLVEAPNFLKPGGFFLFEIGFNQAAAVEALIDRATWRLMKVYSDLQGIPRTIALQKLA